MEIRNLRIFNRGNGWYVPAKNYKDKDDKAYLGVYFVKSIEQPEYHITNEGYDYLDINCEATFESYKKQVKSITVFKYEVCNETDHKNNFGNDDIRIGNDTISQEELPFY